ncbi:MAG: hypothetical protein ACRDE7_03570 [Sphingobacterium sp.]
MKYEIIKGSEKDFDGAPEGALYVLSCIGENYYSVDMVHTLCGLDISDSDHEYIIADRRPITEPEWDGVGLPPVGCECEVKVGGDNYNLCRIVYSDSNAGVAFIYLGGDDEKYCGIIDCVTAGAAYGYFRPIRSEADNKRDAAIESLMRIVCGPSQASATVNKIYDAIAAGKIPGVKLED